MDVEECRTRIRQKVATGELYGDRHRTKFRMRPGRDGTCSVCGETIKAVAIEYVFPSDLVLDGECFRIWLDELSRRTS
jgi:hypothetical protein